MLDRKHQALSRATHVQQGVGPGVEVGAAAQGLPRLVAGPFIWGFRSGRMNQAYFAQLVPGDPLLLYVTREVGGFIGLATAREKYIDRETPYWPDEVRARRVIYPLRMRMDLELVLPQELWSNLKMSRRLVPYTLRGFAPLDDALAAPIVARMEREWRVASRQARPTLVTPGPAGEELRETPPQQQPAHNELKAMLVDVGKFQNYVTAVEYQIPLPDQQLRLDVVWKRELEGVPTFAFEVELSGNVERAAFARWNSRPYLIVGNDDVARARNMFNPDSA